MAGYNEFLQAITPSHLPTHTLTRTHSQCCFAAIVLPWQKNINEIMEELLKLFENGAQPDRKAMERLLDKLPNKRRKPA